MKSFTLTTPLYYVNDVPHIGHAYTTIAADILARWQLLRGHSVFFLTGTDEHGAKIADAAAKTNESPQAYTDRIALEFRKLWEVLNISFTDFIRTTESRHKTVVQSVFEKLKESGDIYKGVYEDWYCLHDESYFSEGELVDKKCPMCGRDVQRLKEESYFFKLSKYQNALLEHFASHPEFLSPPNRASEIVNFVKSGLKDLSVSRTKIKWGVPVLSDPEHVVYVWFDALLNYISVFNYSPQTPNNPLMKRHWPCDIHLVGKEIFRFHTVIWPAMLMALGIELPKKVFAHGWWTVEGTKMSKSLGNVVDPNALVAEYGVDAFRYFLFREVPFGNDGDFSEKALLTRHNSELANNLGNLLQRTCTILIKNLNGVVHPKDDSPSQLLTAAKADFQSLDKDFTELNLGGVLEKMVSLMMKTNKYIDDQAPWKMTSDQTDELSAVLYECLRVLKAVALVLYPFMPGKMQQVWERLGEPGLMKDTGEAALSTLIKDGNVSFVSGQNVQKGDPLFMRIGGRWK